MTKKLLLLVAAFALSFQIIGCTSKVADGEAEIVENADVDKIEAEDSLAEGESELSVEDPTMQAALGEEKKPAETGAAVAEAAPLELPADVASAPTLDESSLNDVPPTASEVAVLETPPTDLAETPLETSTDMPAESVIEAGPAEVVAETSPLVESSGQTPLIEGSGSETNTSDYSAPVAKTGNDTLKKMALTTPYQTPAGWVNTVYMARPGETLKDISQKIFAADKVKDLKKIAENSYLKWRSVKPGDKLYYVSPNRPDDSAKTLFYYEDMGMVPETYIAKKGDNLKKVAKETLGYKNAYMEMWAANPVDSKGKLTEGETLRYWRSASGVTNNTMASNTAKSGAAQLVDAPPAGQFAPPPTAEAPPLPEAAPPTEMPVPPDATASLPPPPSMDQQPMPAMDAPPVEAATASLPPPPPPPPAEMAPPPPMDDMASAKPKVSDNQELSEVGALDNDTMMSLGAVGVLTAALAFALIRRKKKKAAEMAAAMNETHVGS